MPNWKKVIVSGSDANLNHITASNLLITNTASITYFEAVYETSSIIYSSGSTKFGDTIDDNHWFTGSMLITGSTFGFVGLGNSSTQTPLVIDSAGVITTGSAYALPADISGSWQGEGFVSASQTFLSTGQRSGNSGITGSLELSGTGNLTASGDISASGNLFALVTDNSSTGFKTVMYDTATGKFHRTGSYGGGGGGGGSDSDWFISGDDSFITSSRATNIDNESLFINSGTLSGTWGFDNVNKNSIVGSIAGEPYSTNTGTTPAGQTGHPVKGLRTYVTAEAESREHIAIYPVCLTGKPESPGESLGLNEGYPYNYLVFNQGFSYHVGEEHPGPVQPDGGGGVPSDDEPGGMLHIAGGIQITDLAQRMREAGSGSVVNPTGSYSASAATVIRARSGILFFETGSTLNASGSYMATSASANIGFSTSSKNISISIGSTAAGDSKEVMFISKSGDNPRVGVGTNDPKGAFDFKEVEDSAVGTELLLRTARPTRGGDVGDGGGSINFIIDSSSFNDIKISGSLAKIKTVATSVGTGGIQGKLVFTLTKGSITPVDAFEYGFGIGPVSLFSVVQTASLVMTDFSPTGNSEFQMRDYSDNLRFHVLDGSVLMSGSLGVTGSAAFNSHITASGNVSSSATSTASFGTYLGDGSNLTGISTDPFPYTGSAIISGSLEVIGDTNITGSINLQNSSTNRINFDNAAAINQPQIRLKDYATGITMRGNDVLALVSNGSGMIGMKKASATSINFPSAAKVGFTTNTSVESYNPETYFRRYSSGVIGIGYGAVTSANLSGSLTLTNITASGNVSASGTIVGSNLSGTNTGDQDLSTYSTLTQLNASSSAIQDSGAKIRYLYTASTNSGYSPPPGVIAYIDSTVDYILINTSSYNGVNIDGSSPSNDYSKFLYNEVGSLITSRRLSDGAFTTYKVTAIATAFGDPDVVRYQVDVMSYDVSSGSLADGDEVEFVWDKSAGVGGGYSPDSNAVTKTLAAIYKPGYNYLDLFWGAGPGEFDGAPGNLSGVESSASFGENYYVLPAISQSQALTLGSLTTTGNISSSGTIHMLTASIGGGIFTSASLAGGGGGGAVATFTNGANNRIITATGTDGINGESTLTYDGSKLDVTGGVEADSIHIGAQGLTTAGDYGHGAELLLGYTGATAAGDCLYLRSNGSWAGSNAGTLGAHSKGILGISTATDASGGLATRGIVYLNVDPGGSVGDPIYLSTTSGDLTASVVTATGNISRVVGYKLATNIIMFNPSQDWIEIS